MRAQTLPMPQKQQGLQDTLKQARQRCRALLVLRYASLALLIASLLGMLLVGLSKLNLVATPTGLALTSLILVSIMIGAMLAFWPRLSDLDIAKMTERRADLKERLSSAVEFRQQGVDTTAPFYGEQWTDANHYAAQVDVARLFPARIPLTLPVGLLLTLALLLMFFLPTLPAFWSPKQKRDAEDVRVTAITLQKVAEDKEKNCRYAKTGGSQKSGPGHQSACQQDEDGQDRQERVAGRASETDPEI